MIETKDYSLTKKDYTKIVLSKRLRKSWWLYLLLIILGMFHSNQFGKDNFSTFFVIFAFCYPALTFIYLYFWSKSSGHNPIFAKTIMSFDDENIYFKSDDNETKLTPKSIQKVISNNNYWMLYISKGQFVFIPNNIFYSEEDLKKFKTLIRVE